MFKNKKNNQIKIDVKVNNDELKETLDIVNKITEKLPLTRKINNLYVTINNWNESYKEFNSTIEDAENEK